MIVLQNIGSLELIILILLCDLNIVGKIKIFTKQTGLHRISKAHYILLF